MNTALVYLLLFVPLCQVYCRDNYDVIICIVYFIFLCVNSYSVQFSHSYLRNDIALYWLILFELLNSESRQLHVVLQGYNFTKKVQKKTILARKTDLSLVEKRKWLPIAGNGSPVFYIVAGYNYSSY